MTTAPSPVRPAVDGPTATVTGARLRAQDRPSGPVGTTDGQTPVVTRVADVAAERVTWHWEGRIPRGKVTVLDGDPGLGKSTLTLALAADTSRGRALPGGQKAAPPASVVLLSAEDGIGDTIRPRLEAADADLSRVVVFEHLRDLNGDLRAPSIPRDLDAVERIVRDEGATLVVIDPLMAFLGANVDSHRDQDVRRALHGLATLADRTKAAVLVVRHLNKSGGPQAIYRGGGSIGIIGAARAGLLVATDPDDEHRRIVAVTKSNLGPKPDALAYRLVSDHSLGCAAVVWDGTTTHSADDLLAVPEDRSDRSERDEVVEWLTDFLSDGPRSAEQVFKAARAERYSDSTLKRAKKAVARSRKAGMDSGWMWELLPSAVRASTDEEGEGGPSPEGGHLRTSSGRRDHLRAVAKGPCATCRADTDRYGPAGKPLCSDCMQGGVA
ncbi:MAG: hypothetical protein JWO27_2922 [Frankiales bacterium]|nr:hypothetical protein [Frankiales bacterium]